MKTLTLITLFLCLAFIYGYSQNDELTTRDSNRERKYITTSSRDIEELRYALGLNPPKSMQLTIQQTREASILLIRKEKQEEERIELYKKKERKEKITKIIILSSLAFLFPTVIFITRRHLYKFYNKMKSLKKETKIYVISSLVGIALLTLAIFIEPANRRHSGLPYGFYTFLRIYITLLFSYFAYLRYKQEKIILFLIFVCAAILFNPIIQIHLNRDIWQIIDITATAIIFLHLIFLISKKRIERG